MQSENYSYNDDFLCFYLFIYEYIYMTMILLLLLLLYSILFDFFSLCVSSLNRILYFSEIKKKMRAATKWICRRMVRKRHMSTKIGPSIDTCMKMPSSTYIYFCRVVTTKTTQSNRSSGNEQRIHRDVGNTEQSCRKRGDDEERYYEKR